MYLTNVLNLIGTPYVYGGRDRVGVDCWGLVALALYEAGGQKLYHWWTDAAWENLTPVDPAKAVPGDLVFYPGHVVVLAGGGCVVSASYGTRHIRTPEQAMARNPPARVVAWPTVHYRSGPSGTIRGYRSMKSLLA
jgi:cell wall-associated NlpC family hydrolase